MIKIILVSILFFHIFPLQVLYGAVLGTEVVPSLNDYLRLFNSAKSTTSLPTNTLHAVPVLYGVVSLSVVPGGELVVGGGNFSSNTRIFLNNLLLQDCVVRSIGEISCIIPLTTPKGLYTLSVYNGSIAAERKISVAVDSSIVYPKIEKIYGTLFMKNDTVKIDGSGFKNKNTIRSIYGNIKAISKDGTSLTFKISKFSNFSMLRHIRNQSNTPVAVTFVIDNGIVVSKASTIYYK